MVEGEDVLVLHFLTLTPADWEVTALWLALVGESNKSLSFRTDLSSQALSLTRVGIVVPFFQRPEIVAPFDSFGKK